MRIVRAIQYLTPLREGGSVPAIVGADDDGMYVLKFHGAAQGPRALVAEVVCGELARHLGLPIAQTVLIELDPVLAKSEPDPEIQAVLAASGGTNFGIDYLPGALNWDPALTPSLDRELAARIVWFDAFVENVDRTVRNPNLLTWHQQLYLIDHGAALYWQHNWADHLSRANAKFAMVRQHVLLPLAGDVRAADRALAPLVTPTVIEEIVDAIPQVWIDRVSERDPIERRGYLEHLCARIAGPRDFVEEAARAQSV
ncbi:MAG TPA: HipA family kinase [Kofleriaceae bacterium]|nr:HipA family kinase [Kofleriaceae bacterium]